MKGMSFSLGYQSDTHILLNFCVMSPGGVVT